MSVNWLWKNLIGNATYVRKVNGKWHKLNKSNLYWGSNCYLVELYETKDDNNQTYDRLLSFFNDIPHMEKCFGLRKWQGKFDNLFKTNCTKLYEVELQYDMFKDKRDYKLIETLVKTGVKVKLVSKVKCKYYPMEGDY